MEPAQRNYVEIATAYAKEAALDKNKHKFCKWIRLAAKRFLGDLKRAKDKGNSFYFDEWHANDPCDFIEKLPHVEGTWDTPTIVLHRSDVFFVVNLFGFRNRDGSRRFTVALKAIARKNAKSTVAAAIGLYCETCEGEEGPQVISGATTGSQARIVFGIAKRMVEKTADMREAFHMEAFAHSIACYDNGGSFKPINAKASSQDGLNPSCVILDEIHAHKDADLLNVLSSAAGARKNPLFLYTTTEGYESPGPWAELRQFAKQVLEGVVEADHFLCVIYAIDDEDDEFDESCWIKANPLMEVNPILLNELRKQAIEAKSMPSKLAEFKIKRVNRQSSTATGWINFDHWKACAGTVDLEFLKPYPCYGGLDLANTTDLCSFRLVWLVDGVLYTWGRRWVPETAVKNRTVRGTVPYAGWVALDHLELIPGEVIDHDVIEAAVMDAHENFNLQGIGYDQWNAKQLTSKLTEQGVNMQVFVQGPKSFHPAMQHFELAYRTGKFRHGNDPVLTWCASNLVARTDVNLNMAPDKKKSADKIDDMVALLMAIGVMPDLTGDLLFDQYLRNAISQ
jgi:phage terminase large subunit-like protein